MDRDSFSHGGGHRFESDSAYHSAPINAAQLRAAFFFVEPDRTG